MGQELIKPGSDGDKFAARVGALFATIERDAYLRDTLPVPIDGDTRKMLEEQRRALHVKLRGIGEAIADRQAAGKAIGAFLLGYYPARPVDSAATLAAYVSTLDAQPLFAILQAIQDFKDGAVFDIDPKDGSRVPFSIDRPPSAPRMLDQVKKRAGDVQEQHHKVSRLLAVTQIREPEVPPEERNRVAELMADLATKMKMGAAAERKTDEEKIRAEADQARANARRIIQEANRKRAENSAAAQAG